MNFLLAVQQDETVHQRAVPQYILLLILFFVISLQLLVQLWKKYHPKSYNYTTLALMWILPFSASVYFRFWRMIILWFIYTICSFQMFKRAMEKPLASKTPRVVYSFFFWVYRLSIILTGCGFLMVALQFLGIYHEDSFPLSYFLEFSFFRFCYMDPIIILFYGLYYGVLVRDSAEVCADKMASSLKFERDQYYLNENVMARQCGICSGGYEAEKDLEGVVQMKSGKEYLDDEKVTLNCGHTFHEFCIKGWVIIGKKETCPYCSEKVDLSEQLKKNPWDTDSITWVQFLDVVRYVIVWNPLILICLHFILTYLVK